MSEAIGLSEDALVKALVVQRMVPFRGKISSETSMGIRKVLIALDQKQVSPITLHIGSGGGDVKAAYEICDSIQMVRSPVHGLVIERCASMAVDILLSCKERRALPGAHFFLHFTRCGFEAISDFDEMKKEDMDAYILKMTRTKKERAEFYARKLKKTPEEINAIFRRGERHNYEYSPQEALEMGLIEKIDSEFKFFAPNGAPACTS
jgi:ATP-dependent protease ClpP protease subunit